MIVRYAFFEGQVKEGKTEAFRKAILDEVLPTWKAFPGALNVRVCFSEERDDGAPEFPLIQAITFADMAAVDHFLEGPERIASRAATMSVVEQYFDGRIHHHVTVTEDFPL